MWIILDLSFMYAHFVALFLVFHSIKLISVNIRWPKNNQKLPIRCYDLIDWLVYDYFQIWANVWDYATIYNE